MWDLIDGLVRDGTTTVLTTQYLDEAERLADQIAVIDQGVVIARGTANELKAQIGGARLTVTGTTSASLDAMATTLSRLPMAVGVTEVDPVTRSATVTVSDTEGVVPAVVRLLDADGIDIADVEVAGPTLDDVFLQLTGRSTATPDEDNDSAATTTKRKARK
jgi:ABC-2 type transport system ATP-binding protein